MERLEDYSKVGEDIDPDCTDHMTKFEMIMISLLVIASLGLLAVMTITIRFLLVFRLSK